MSTRLPAYSAAAFATAICELHNRLGTARRVRHAPTRISEAPASTPEALTWTFYLRMFPSRSMRNCFRQKPLKKRWVLGRRNARKTEKKVVNATTWSVDGEY